MQEMTEKEQKAQIEAEHGAEVEFQRSRLRRSMSRGKDKEISRKVDEKR